MILSPCVGVCDRDPVTDICRGCARAASEIAGWGSVDETARRAVWAELPARQNAAGLRLRRPDWDPNALRERVIWSLAEPGRAAWIIGRPGAAAVFSRPHDPNSGETRGETAAMTARDDAVSVRAEGVALRLRLDPKLRIYNWHRALDPVHATAAAPPLETTTLAHYKTRSLAAGPAVLTELGPDADAIDEAARDAPLFDLGLARSGLRLALRVADPNQQAALRALGPAPLGETLEAAAALLAAVGPVWVMESAGARIEIAAGPQSGAASNAGALLLDPALWDAPLTVAPGAAFPKDFFPVAALHYADQPAAADRAAEP